MARLVLTQPGEDVDVGGDVTVFGTATGGEVITVLRGTITLDPSFNLGGDIVRLPDDARYYTIRMIGSFALLQGLGASVSIPVGSAGLEVAFNDVSRTLRFDAQAGAVRLGDQVIGATLAGVTPAGGVPTLVGTEGADVIIGTAGNDAIDGLGGADRIDGGSGNDVIRGGMGDDEINGSFGNDELFGGPGNDRMLDNLGTSNSIDGGTGNDWISIENNTVGSCAVSGGDGDDLIEISIGASGSCTIDAGAGADRVLIASAGIPVSVALGAGRDQLVLPAHALNEPRFGVITVSDFDPGPLGDIIEFNAALSTWLIGWTQSVDPFSGGFLRLVDRAGGAVLQVDRDGAGGSAHGFQDLIVFSGKASSSFSKENFEGYVPRSTATAPPPDLAAHAQVERSGTWPGHGVDGLIRGHEELHWPIGGHFLA